MWAGRGPAGSPRRRRRRRPPLSPRRPPPPSPLLPARRGRRGREQAEAAAAPASHTPWGGQRGAARRRQRRGPRRRLLIALTAGSAAPPLLARPARRRARAQRPRRARHRPARDHRGLSVRVCVWGGCWEGVAGHCGRRLWSYHGDGGTDEPRRHGVKRLAIEMAWQSGGRRRQRPLAARLAYSAPQPAPRRAAPRLRSKRRFFLFLFKFQRIT